MVAYSFKGRFVEPIRTRSKRQTIRSVGKKRHARKGEKIQVYTGDRFHPRKVGEAVCQDAREILMNFGTIDGLRPFVVIGEIGKAGSMAIMGAADLDDFAVRDGFGDWQALADFWAETHDNPAEWSGIIILWGDTFVAPSSAGEQP